MPRGESIAHDSIRGNVERRDPVEEIFLAGLEKGEVRFVIDHFHVSSGFFARFRALELNIILVRDQIRGHEHATLGKNRSECALRDRRFLLPRSKIIMRLARHVHADQRKWLLFNVLVCWRRCRFFFYRGTGGNHQSENNGDK